MCGRFVIAKASAELVEPLGIDHLEADLDPSWNVAPTSLINTVFERGADEDESRSGRFLGAARWGMLAPWSKSIRDGVRTFNARVETAAKKPTFRASVKSKRAVIPANGFYEWHKLGDSKRPYFVHDANAELIYFAGLYSWWRDPAAESDKAWVLSATILTRAGGGPIEWLHDRMPITLAATDLVEWLDQETVGDQSLLDEFAARGLENSERLSTREVGLEVGNVRNNGPALIEAVV